jgi:putative heme-binding domain-containing protein
MRWAALGLIASIGPIGLSGDARAQAVSSALPTLEAQLKRESPESLAGAARAAGDSTRGAMLFYRPDLACAKCHASPAGSVSLGPDLTRIGRAVSGAELVDSVLDPSKTIRKGYETILLAMTDGKTYSGVLAEENPSTVVIRDAAQDGKPVTIPRAAIEERKSGGASLMPAGQVNQLASRQEFLDLLAFLLEVTDSGPTRALALRPVPSALVPPPLPEYESQIDHAGMIASLGHENYRRGEHIYRRLCINCHGTKDQPGSMPTSLAFASGGFKTGGDPFSMYQTLTRGTGMMAAQTTLVPEKKYDVIHYIREAYLRPFNPSQYAPIDRAYLDRLPKGNSRGPNSGSAEPWAAMDYGPSLMLTVQGGNDGSNISAKGIAIRLDPGAGGVARGKAWVVFEHDTMRVATGWAGEGFIDWNSIHFNGRHGVHPKTSGRVHFSNPTGPGWADPLTGSFDDPRPRGRDGRPYGPLPPGWSHYKGLYHAGERAIVSYTVGRADILESFGLASAARDESPIVFARDLYVGAAPHDLWMKVALAQDTAVVLVGDNGPTVHKRDRSWLVHIPAREDPVTFGLLISDDKHPDWHAAAASPRPALRSLTVGGPRRWPQTLKTRPQIGSSDGPFAVDTLVHPESNPWLAQMRFSGLDFLPGGKQLVVCTWDGDVWKVSGIDDLAGELTWQRIASGLFQPLGLKVQAGQVYVGCRDQIVLLHDLNGDGETDFYENFNSDHQVTEHFHEFAMDLQTDPAGNFYYAKAARHGLPGLVPHHGTLLKVDRDGGRTEILATGFRAPNGVCLNPDGSFFLTDQEGFWLPKNRINRVEKGGFYGNIWGYTDVTDPSDSAMEQPVCWITNATDRSPGGIVAVTSDAWGPLKGSMLNLSYGMGKVFVVPYELVEGQAQGGVSELPGATFPTGVMRGRFHPGNGQLYLCGMFAWAGNREQPGGLYRLRATGKPIHVPVRLSAQRGGISITFAAPLDRATATDRSRYAVTTWSLRRSAQYGSKHYDEKSSDVTAASLADDGCTVFLAIPDIKPTWCMAIRYDIRGSRGEIVDGRIDNTIHQLRD